MANTIILKRSATPAKVPTTGQLSLGEIAINTYDGKLFIKKDNGTASVVEIGGVNSVNGETGVVTLDTGDISENGNLYFTNTRARSALSAGTGISYNSSTGEISTTQNLSTAGTPTFAGLTLTGNVTLTGNIIPTADNTYSLGSPSYQFKDVFVGPGSLYINGKEVLQEVSGTMTFSADPDQGIQIKTTGTGNVTLTTAATGVVAVGSTLQMGSGYNITDSAGVEVNFGDNIDMNNNKIVGLGTPTTSTDAATKGYVDTQIGTINTTTISQGNSSVAVVDSGTGTVTVTVDGSTALTVSATGVVVAGNFTVQGTTTTVESNTVSVADNIITLNSDVTGAPSQNAGIEVERGDDANVSIRWNEGTDVWQFTNDGASYHPLPASTTDLTEGTNLYYTDTRARNALSASSATGISYNSGTGAFSLGSIPNSSLTNSSITINGTAVSLGGTRTLNSDAIGEGSTNLYYTDTRSRAALSATTATGAQYNSTTGVISLSGIPNSSLTNSSVTVGSTAINLGSSSTTLAGLTSVTSTSFIGALTGNADTATSAGKWTTARTITLGGDLSGSVSIDGSGDVTLTATVAGNTVALGTDTTGNYVASVGTGTGLTGGASGSEGAALTLSLSHLGLESLTDPNADRIAFWDDSAGAFAWLTAGTGLSISDTTISNSGVTSVNGSTGAITNVALTTGKLSQFAATTSAELAGVISDETGSGALVFATSPTLTTPTLGVATATSINGTSIPSSKTLVVTTDNLSVFAATTSAQLAGVISDETGSGALTFATAPTFTTSIDGGATFGAFASVTTLTEGYTGTAASTHNIATGAVANATTKTINIGTGGAAGSTTAITMGAASGTSTVTVNGSLRATADVTAYYSDLRLKTNIVPIADALGKVEALNGVEFDPNETALGLGVEDKHQIGVIAQEVEAVAPELVVESALAGYKTVKYDKLTALLIEAVKELSAKVKTLEAQLGGSTPQL